MYAVIMCHQRSNSHVLREDHQDLASLMATFYPSYPSMPFSVKCFFEVKYDLSVADNTIG